MPLNVPSVTTDRISFGPATVYLAAAGTTPSTDIGAIRTDDGVTIEVSNETTDIMQGNPKLIEYTFSSAQGLMVKVASLQYDYTRLAWAMGAGTTTSAGGVETFAWGGDPLVKQVAVHIRHLMPVSGNTLDLYIWKAVTEAAPSHVLNHDPHAFELSFKAQRSATDWGGTALDSKEQLYKMIETD